MRGVRRAFAWACVAVASAALTVPGGASAQRAPRKTKHAAPTPRPAAPSAPASSAPGPGPEPAASGSASAAPESAPGPAGVPISLDAAMRTALANNAGLVVVHETAEAVAAEVTIAGATFAPRLLGDLHYYYNHNPGTAIFTEATDHQWVGNLSLVGHLHTGLDYKLEWNTIEQELDSAATVYRPYQATTVRLTLTQPLLRNAGLDTNRAPIVIASLRRDASRALAEAEVQRIVADVEIAYWGLVLAIKEREVRQSALTLAREQLEGSRTRFRLGNLAQVDVTEAEQAVAQRVDDIEASNQELAEAEGRLLTLLQPRVGQPGADGAPVVPSDAAESAPVLGVLAQIRQTAQQRRPDVRAARANLQAEQAALAVARNHLWPAVDLVGFIGATGFSGTLDKGYGTTFVGGPMGPLNYVDNPAGTQLPPYFPDRTLEGDFAKLFDNFHYLNGQIGLRLEIPLDNSLAAGQRDQQEHLARRQRATVEEIEREIDTQVITAYKRLRADVARIRATAEAARLAGELLEGQRRKFKGGAGVSFDVLRAVSELTRARIALVRAQVTGRISQARLSLAEGTYLEERRVQVR